MEAFQVWLTSQPAMCTANLPQIKPVTSHDRLRQAGPLTMTGSRLGPLGRQAVYSVSKLHGT